MPPRADTPHPLPAQRAFLVQVHAEAEVTQGRLAERVEHVVSGQATHLVQSTRHRSSARRSSAGITPSLEKR